MPTATTMAAGWAIGPPLGCGIKGRLLFRQQKSSALGLSTVGVKAMLTAETNAARDLGIFGSPMFTVGRELFWGDDRRDDATSWGKFGRVQRPNP